jgi:hypothetical protein
MSDDFFIDGEYVRDGVITSNYKTTAHAISELIDNSIESAFEANLKCNCEIICLEKNSNGTKRIKEILILDDAGGMDPELLKISLKIGRKTRKAQANKKAALGKYGIGLPEASMANSDVVEVYSWQKGKVFYTFFDRNKITSDINTLKIPDPIEKEIPEKYKKLISSEIKQHGTLIVWSDVQSDRASWVTNKGLFKNAEDVLGKTYRHYIANGSLKINLRAFDEDSDTHILSREHIIRSNDPLYLDPNSTFPAENGDPKNIFMEYSNREIEVALPNGIKTKVKIKISHATKENRLKYEKKQSAQMVHLKKNMGVSIMRAGREITHNMSWNNDNTTERWWGCEISFEENCDKIFGVTKDKQHARNLENKNLNEDAADNGMSIQEYAESIEENDFHLKTIYEISDQINSSLGAIRKIVGKQTEGSRSGNGIGGTTTSRAIKIATNKRKEDGFTAAGDSETMDDEDKKKSLEEKLAESTYSEFSEAQKSEFIKNTINNNYNYIFLNKELIGSTLFDFSINMGQRYIFINTKHPLYEHFYKLASQEDMQSGEEADSLVALRILITAWIRMEEETPDNKRSDLEDIRARWSGIAKAIFNEVPEKNEN